MILNYTPGTIKKFRRTPWRFQQTVERADVDQMEAFIAAIISAHGGLSGGMVAIDEVVFDLTRMTALCAVPPGKALERDSSITAETKAELAFLLTAVFGDGPDFIFVPTPKPFVFYSDHDDWITFFANTKSNLNGIIGPLEALGIRLVSNWQRVF